MLVEQLGIKMQVVPDEKQTLVAPSLPLLKEKTKYFLGGVSQLVAYA